MAPAEPAMLLVSDTAAPAARAGGTNYMALRADVASASLVGITGLTATVTSLNVTVNRSSDAANPNHAWEVPATYPVTLTVTNEGGSDLVTVPVSVSSCWSPAATIQTGICYGGPVHLTAAPGSGWIWSTGATTRTIATPIAGAYWVNIDDGTGCWGHVPTTVVLNNCGDESGDANLDGVTDAADVSAREYCNLHGVWKA